MTAPAVVVTLPGRDVLRPLLRAPTIAAWARDRGLCPWAVCDVLARYAGADTDWLAVSSPRTRAVLLALAETARDGGARGAA